MMNGKKLRYIREKQGLTLAQLAEQLGTNARQIWRWESGENDPSGEKMGQLARILNVSVDYLLDLSDMPETSKPASELDSTERKILDALRRGDKLEAIRVIVEA
jgi:transcriptional regulator with XRE-family HTH domain